MEEDTLHDIELQGEEKIIIFGDIHGQFPDFIRVIEMEGLPNNKLKYVREKDLICGFNFDCLKNF